MKFITLCALSISTINLYSMHDVRVAQPASLIRIYINNPRKLPELLSKSFSARHNDQTIRLELANFHDDQYNNLLHVTVQAFISVAKDTDYQQKLADLKIFIDYLLLVGVPLDEMNDNHHTPLFLAYKAQHHDLATLLENLGAGPTRFSVEPEIRACKKKCTQGFKKVLPYSGLLCQALLLATMTCYCVSLTS